MTTEPKIAQTWEECAQHVEAGGVVEYLSNIDDVWRDDSWSAGAYRMLDNAPGLSRRLLPIAPIAAPATPAGMTPGPEVDGRPTWYGTARDAKVAGMTEARGWTNERWSYVNRWDAAAIVQARYPMPKPKTVRVYWWEAVGRTDPHDREIIRVGKVDGWKPLVHFVDSAHMVVESPDGTVEVLAKDGES